MYMCAMAVRQAGFGWLAVVRKKRPKAAPLSGQSSICWLSHYLFLGVCGIAGNQ